MVWKILVGGIFLLDVENLKRSEFVHSNIFLS